VTVIARADDSAQTNQALPLHTFVTGASRTLARGLPFGEHLDVGDNDSIGRLHW